MKSRKSIGIALIIGIFACSSTPTSDQPEVRNLRKYRIWYTGPELHAELDYRWADFHLGDEWLILKLSIAGQYRAVTPVEMEAVRMRTPQGHDIALPDQAEFRRNSGSIRHGLESVNAWSYPSERFVASRRACGEWFYFPSSFYQRTTLYVSPSQFCTGPLAFRVPGGVQPGRWVLMIDLEESVVRIPFELGNADR
jgi:hypothetical protein